ncbi:MAG: hypothetical protein FWE68_04840 [Defluviitaleaceae bacterium]|nr:hypothetical protein [Defluviitaleaceae bacterium]
MKQHFVIRGRLSGLNELLGASNRHWAQGHRLKRDNMMLVMLDILAAGIKPVEGKAVITIACFEPNAKRDTDNVKAGACKIILDALQQMGVLQGDGRKYLLDTVMPPVRVDRENPRIEVAISPA